MTAGVSSDPNQVEKNQTADHMPAFEADALFTSFEDILKQENDKEWTSTGSSHSQNDSSVEMMQSSQAYLLKHSENACLQGRQYTQEMQHKASQCVEGAKDNINECIGDFFSPQQEKARALMLRKVVAKIRYGLHAFHDTVDSMLVRIFEQPLQEVEVRKTLDQSGSNSFNEDITIDSELKRQDIDDSYGKSKGSSEETKNDKPTRRARLASKKGKKEKCIKTILDHEVEREQPAALDIKSVPTTESDVESLTRFKEQLHENKTDAVNFQNEEEILDEVLGDKESRSEPDTSTCTSMEELDLALRTDIEKLGRIAVIHASSPIEQSSSDVLKITASSSTPLRGNRHLHEESEFVDLCPLKAGQGFAMDPIVPTRSLSIRNGTNSFPLQMHRARPAAPGENVIDLTMYDEAGIEAAASMTR